MTYTTGHSFNGQALEPFNFRRQTALQALLGEMGGTVLTEVVAATWLMLQPYEIAGKVRRKPADYVNEVDRFANDNSLLLTSPALDKATTVYSAILENTGGEAPAADPEDDE